MSTKAFEERVTTRYNQVTKSTFDQLMDLVSKNSIPKSTAQLLLVQRGLQHTTNPEPLIKEKVVYKDRVVYKDKPPVDKVVHKSIPKEEHITEHLTELDGGIDTQLRPSGDKLSSGDKANPRLALDEKKSPSNSNVGAWVGGGILASIVIYGLVKLFTS